MCAWRALVLIFTRTHTGGGSKASTGAEIHDSAAVPSGWVQESKLHHLGQAHLFC